jgi:transposase-like protein
MRTTFSSEEIVELKKNPCVFNCTAKSVHYTYEFKRSAIDLYAQGVGPKEIWRRAGFDVSKWNKNYFVLTLRDWKRIVTRDGEEGLNKLGGLQYDRGPSKTDKDKLKRLELQVKYLQAENAFLAKLRAKRAERNSGRTKNTGLYEN